MAQLKHFPLPDVGEGLTEAEILTWRVRPGDTVTLNQVIVEIETAKAAVELPCPYAGRVSELLARPGQTVEVGTPIIAIDLDPGSAASAEAEGDEKVSTLVGYGPRAGKGTRRPRKHAESRPVAPAPRYSDETRSGGRVPLAKPPVRKLAKDLGVDLETISGSGSGGVITREDVEAASAPAVSPAPAAPAAAAREHRVPIRSVRRATAEAVVRSAFTAPHVTEFLTVDVTPMMEFRERLRSQPQFQEVKITPLAFAAKAVCLAVRRTPDVNAAWDEAAGEIVYKDYVHLGIAAATQRGLIVPKVRDADGMSLRELALSLDGLTAAAREGRTAPADMVNGTFTITNVGVFGVDTGTPILTPGESAILALGAIRDQPWVVDGQVVPRKVCQLALSFDHRVVDGQQGSQFLADVGALLADPGMAIAY